MDLESENKKLKRQNIKLLFVLDNVLDLLPDYIDKQIIINKIKIIDKELIKNE